MLLKTRIIDALIAGASTTGLIRKMTGLPSNIVSRELCKLRQVGLIEVASTSVVYSGARPGHIWRLKEDANG